MRKERWDKLFGNQFNQNINWAMLVENGFKKKGRYYFLGESRPNKDDVEESEILYDREYVVQYIAKKIIEPLQPEYNELQRIIADAWKVYKKQNIQER
ncbi:MAG: hypothetical protein QNJ51_03050 [Calothrix sp. MO_167.B12]|nr:hypothetical protein [Calothrix sp. MO_167.B12]